jgi:hypothetical protein
MKQLRTIPKLEVRPEQLIFVCPSCNGFGPPLGAASRARNREKNG